MKYFEIQENNNINLSEEEIKQLIKLLSYIKQLLSDITILSF